MLIIKNIFWLLILCLVSVTGCSPSQEIELDTNEILLDGTLNVEDSLPKIEITNTEVVDNIEYSNAVCDDRQYRLNLINGNIETPKGILSDSVEMQWEIIDSAEINANQSYQLCVALSPVYDDDGAIFTIVLFLVIDKSSGDILYKRENDEKWKLIQTKNLETCNNCYSFNFSYNINMFEVFEATNDSTGAIFNLIGHNGEITKRESWIWEKGRCKENDMR